MNWFRHRTGSAAGLNRQATLRRAVRVVAGLWLSAVLPASPQADEPPAGAPILLTNAAQVAALGTNIPNGRYEARLPAVVLLPSPSSRRLYVQSGDFGVQVNLAGSADGFRVGNLVEVSGVVMGDGIPALRLAAAKATALGNAPLPAPKPVTIHQLVQGENPFRYVRLRGQVRDMYSARGKLNLRLTANNYPFDVIVQKVNGPLPVEWTDAVIEVTGLPFPTYNVALGRPTKIDFYANTTNDVRVLKSGLADRFDGRPLLTIAEAAKLPNDFGARCRVAGTVTIHRPGAVIFIEDGTGAMRVDQNLRFFSPPAEAERIVREPQTRLAPGERVEVVGTRYDYYSLTPCLQSTEFRRAGRAEFVKPLAVSVRELIEGRHAGRLVTLTARLIDQRRLGTASLKHYMTIALRVDDDVFQAQWEGDAPVEWNLQTDSYVQVTGVNDAEGGPTRKRSTFQLLLRSPADIVPVPPPPVWTRREFQRIAAAGGAVALLAGVWILLQRWQMLRLERRVAQRTADLSASNVQLKQEVAARERAEAEVQRALAQEKQLSELKSRFVSMVSHEFRTPLGIITSSAEILDAYLDRLTPEDRRTNLRDITDATRQMSRMMEEVLLLGRVEAGKMTCKPAPLDLAVFGQRLVDEMASATNRRCPIQYHTATGLPEAQADEGLLRHVLTNLLNNAVKYSPPGSPVDFAIAAHEHLAAFTVRDRGIGIPENDARLLFQAFHRGRNVAATPGTGLGMTVVKRCVELHGGKIAFESQEGRGTTFVVALPLFGPAPDGNSDGTTQFLRAALAGTNPTVIA